MSGLTWGYGEVVNIDNAFNQKTAAKEKTKQGGAEGEAQDTVRGEIEVMIQGNMMGAGNKTSGKKVTAYPADSNIIRTPLVGEHVICFQGPGPEAGSAPPDTTSGKKDTGLQFDLDWYYLPPVSLGGSVHGNFNPLQADGGVKSKDKTVQDGEKKSKTEAYENAEAGVPGTTNKKPTQGGSTNTEQDMSKLPPSLDSLSASMIEKFQKLEQSVLEYKGKLDTGLDGFTSDGLKDREKKIEEYKKELVEGGYTGEFKESTEKFGYGTNTGYLEITTLNENNYNFKEMFESGKKFEYVKVKSLSNQQRGIGDKQYFTLDELNNFNPDPVVGTNGPNTNPNTSDQVKGGGKLRGENQDFVEQEDLNNLQPFEGDLLIQGRFGNSMRLGSTINPKDPSRYIAQPSYAEGQAGPLAPINIFRAGQSPVMTNSANDYIIEDINGDKASIYMCSGQQIAIQLASPEFRALEESAGATDGDSTGCAGSRRCGNSTNPSFNCSGGSSGHINASNEVSEQLNNPPADISDLEELEGDYEYFNTTKGTPNYAKVVGTDKIVLLQGNPVRKSMAGRVLNLFQAAKRDGIILKLNSSFRGLWQINHPRTGVKLASGQVNCRYSCAINKSWSTKANMQDRKSPLWTARSSKFKPYVAIPGTSRHQSGTAIDLDYKRYKLVNGKKVKTKTTDKDGVYAWLVANSYKFGFVRTVTTEEWHFEYNPEWAAKGPFGRLKPSSSNRWHGQDKYFQNGTNYWLRNSGTSDTEETS
tara:strand:+ start:1626 stop:3890 length:2265 start_codon:yes stop_codon:yes gene_type:complete